MYICSYLLYYAPLLLVITRWLGNGSISLGLMLLSMCTHVCRVLGCLTLTVHRCIPFLTPLTTYDRGGWGWSISLVALILGKATLRWRWSVMADGSGVTRVVLVMRGHVYCFIVLNVGSGGDDVECVNHSWDLAHQWDDKAMGRQSRVGEIKLTQMRIHRTIFRQT